MKKLFKDLPLPDVEAYVKERLDDLSRCITFVEFNWLYPDYVRELRKHATIVRTFGDYVVYSGNVWRMTDKGLQHIGPFKQVCRDIIALLDAMLQID